MSDISFHGLAAFVVALGMLGVGVLGLLVEGVLLALRRGAAPRFYPLLLGPALYALIAVGLLVTAEQGGLSEKQALDSACIFLAVGGLLPWIGLRIYNAVRLRAQTRDPGADIGG